MPLRVNKGRRFRLLGFIMRKLRFIGKLLQEPSKQSGGEPFPDTDVSMKLEQNIQHILSKLGGSPDVTVRRFAIRTPKIETAAIVFIDGLVDKRVVNENILRPLMRAPEEETGKFSSIADYAEHFLLTAGELTHTESLAELVEAALSGDIALLLDNQKTALVIGAKGWEKRGVSEPDTEVVVKGPRDGFTETLRTNTALLRRKISHPSLTFETMKLGRKTRTNVCIAYLKGVVHEKLVDEVRRRLRRIDVDGIAAGGFIEELIEDAPFSPFATVAYTERPDVCAAKILEGRVGLIVDGTPVVYTVPMLFAESFQSPDDYNFRSLYSTIVRWGRYLAFLITILAPAVYVALSSYHHELIPTQLLITMAAAEEGTPFPSFVEVIAMGIVFEILREAGIRLPRPIGQAVSIVGALVIGEATVSAGLVGAPVVIVVALTAISSFVAPAQVEAGTILRLFLTGMAGALGAYGIIAGMLIIYVHLSGLRSFGVPYLSPLAPLTPNDLKDTAARAPLWAMFTRPRLIGWRDPERQEFRLMPKPPGSDE